MKTFLSTLPGVFEAIVAPDEVRDSFVFAAWRNIAGGQVSDRTNPLSLEENRLVIAVADKTWKRNLETLASQLLFKLNASLGEPLVDYIEFRIVPDAVPQSTRDFGGREGELASPPVELSVSARKIRDKALRETVISAAVNCLTRQK